MKKILKFTLVAAFLGLFYGCSEDILDNSGVSGVSQQTNDLTNAQLEQGTLTNPVIPEAFLNGIYGVMIQFGSGGTTGHDDFGHKSYDVFSDMLSGDMALSVSTYGWYRASITEFGAPQDFTFGDNRQVWRFYYRVVRAANNVIETLGGNDFTPVLDSNKYNMGQALALRAYAYFYLSQYFQKEYVATEEILPLYIEPLSTNLPKSTASEVYAQMEKDLNDAVTLLNGFTRTFKNQVNQDVARMLLAYVLGAKGGRDADVATITQTVINTGNHTMLSASELVASAGGVNGFDDANSSSWLWGIDITPDNDLALVSWWGQIDAWSYSYAWAGDYKVIDLDLYNAIPSNDARKPQFYSNSGSGRYLQPLYKFRASDAIGGGPRPIIADYVYMRIEEAYLLNAEANARNGAEGAARTSLKALMNLRVPDASYVDGLSGQALKDEIYLQTRIELWGEGKSYLAMKRNKATTVRGANHLSFVGEAIPYNDERMQFEIPQDEIQFNPFLSDQNQ